MVLTLILFGIAGGLASWLISIRWSISLWRIVSIVTLGGILFAILAYHLQTLNGPNHLDYIPAMVRHLGGSVPDIIAADLGAVIVAAITNRR